MSHFWRQFDGTAFMESHEGPRRVAVRPSPATGFPGSQYLCEGVAPAAGAGAAVVLLPFYRAVLADEGAVLLETTCSFAQK